MRFSSSTSRRQSRERQTVGYCSDRRTIAGPTPGDAMMRPCPPRRWLLLLAATAALFAPLASADEAVLRDGRRLPGTLRLVQRRWQFLPSGKSEAVPVASLSQVRLETTSLAPLRAGSVHRVTLRDGQALTAGLLDLNDKTLAFRTAWADRLVLPRSAIASVT